MDWIENLLPFVLLFIYFLSRLGRRREQQGPATTPTEPLTAHEVPVTHTPFEELIRQIQKAAEEAQAARTPAPTVAPPPAPGSPLATPVGPEFRPIGGFGHELHGFGPENPFSEEAFERLPRGLDVTEHAPGHLDRDPHSPLQRPGTPQPNSRHPLAERLRQPGTAREAFLLHEILGAPRYRRLRQ